MRLIDADALRVPLMAFDSDVLDIVDNASTIDPVKHAYMLTDEDGNIECSNCGSGECWGNYCMNCGSRMDGGKNENSENSARADSIVAQDKTVAYICGTDDIDPYMPLHNVVGVIELFEEADDAVD